MKNLSHCRFYSRLGSVCFVFNYFQPLPYYYIVYPRSIKLIREILINSYLPLDIQSFTCGYYYSANVKRPLFKNIIKIFALLFKLTLQTTFFFFFFYVINTNLHPRRINQNGKINFFNSSYDVAYCFIPNNYICCLLRSLNRHN